MTAWSSDEYAAEARRNGVPDDVLNAVLDARERIAAAAPRVVPIVTLGNLGHNCGVSYGWLRAIVNRSVDPYFTFELRKRHGGNVTIFVPELKLLLVQRWINANVLQRLPKLDCAYAYSEGTRIVDAANLHCGARWMIKLDIKDFFPSIDADSVYRVFREFTAYPALLSFELSRICTVGDQPPLRLDPGVGPYVRRANGYLPIGAPTSPMISNLIMRETDVVLSRVAQ